MNEYLDTTERKRTKKYPISMNVISSSGTLGISKILQKHYNTPSRHMRVTFSLFSDDFIE